MSKPQTVIASDRAREALTELDAAARRVEAQGEGGGFVPLDVVMDPRLPLTPPLL